MGFGKIVSEARKDAGIGQKELAFMIRKADGTRISAQYLNDIEAERRLAPPDPIVESIAAALKLNKDYLYYNAGRIPPDLRGRLKKETVIKMFSTLRKGLNGTKPVENDSPE